MIRLALRVARDDAGTVLAELIELAPGGFEERALPDGQVEYVLYGAPGELPELPDLKAAAGSAFVAVSTSEVADDWSDRWKAFHRPVDVTAGGRRLRVRPPWEPAAEGVPELVIDPGRAFGTGGHETTRLCLELLARRAPGGALADWGCGTGVLAIAAARLGYDPVLACDNDAVAVAITRENAAVNGIADLAVSRVDLRREQGPWAPVVVANLLRPLLLEVARRMARAPAVLIASGLLRGEADAVAAAFAARGLRESARRELGDWAALELVAD